MVFASNQAKRQRRHVPCFNTLRISPEKKRASLVVRKEKRAETIDLSPEHNLLMNFKENHEYTINSIIFLHYRKLLDSFLVSEDIG